MQYTRNEILEMALSLSEADRLEIAWCLMDSVPEDPPGLSFDDPGLIEELDRRCREDTESIPASEIWSRRID